MSGVTGTVLLFGEPRLFGATPEALEALRSGEMTAAKARAALAGAAAWLPVVADHAGRPHGEGSDP